MNRRIASAAGASLCGFTLLELLVAIAVTAVLAGLLASAYQRVSRAAQATGCSSNLRQLGTALNQYLAEHNMMMPELRAVRSKVTDDVPALDNTLDKYLVNKAVFLCPGDYGGIGAASGTSYYWNSALNNQSLTSLRFLNLSEDPSHIPVINDKQAFHPYLESKINILYADGHVTKDLRFW